jgi:hypothetical protein
MNISRLRKFLLWLLVIAVILVGGVDLFGEAKPVLAQENPTGPTIIFSQDSVVSRQPIQLTLRSQVAGGTIHYTTNGSLPDANSTPYSGPIGIDKALVIRAQVFKNGAPVGDVFTKSYLVVNYDQTIPVISMVADWADLNTLHTFPEERGTQWERPINLEYFAPGGLIQFNVKAGVRIHGNFSRLYSPKKSYRLYFRKEYGGPGNLEYPLFPDSPVTKFDKLVLRAGFQDTFFHRGIPGLSDKHLAARYINDQVVRNLHRDMGQPIAHGAWALLYLNGEFWGLYNLTERIDQQFLRSYSDKDSDWNIISKESGWENGVWYNREEVKEGDYAGWLENQNWVGSADFSNPNNIGVLENRVDLENVFSYLFLEAYVQNLDWPDANWIIYRRMDPGAKANEGKWRMMVWDAETALGSADGGFKNDINTLDRAYSPHDSITRILEKPFISDCYIKVRFWQRAREYLGVENLNNRPANEVGQLSKERVKAEIIKQAEIVRPFIDMEAQRWAPDMGVANFDHSVQQALKFADERQDIILNHLDIMRNQTFTQCK